ncbi:MAG TPA: phage tail tape measure protein [Candidatus Dormibacteraeota bacterium]|nr:phage tail tape measure protein [Candidatus Dormibacteraeota bacterium]
MLPPLVAHITADIAGFAAGMGEASAIAKKETDATKAAFNGMAHVGKAALLGLGAAAVVGGAAAVKMAGDYESATNRLVTSAGESRKNLDLVRQGTLDMAGQVGFSANDLAKAMYVVESGGQHGAAGLEVLRAAAEGAKAENSDLGTVADAVTSVLQDYHLKAGDAAMVTTKGLRANKADESGWSGVWREAVVPLAVE